MIEYTLPVNKANLFVWGFKDIDGEFTGFGSEADASAVRDPLVRIDAFDSSEWTVLLDPARVQVDATFRKWFGAGTDGAPFTRRGSESWS